MLIIGIDALEYRNWDLGLIRDVGILGDYFGDSHGTRIRLRIILSVEEEGDVVGCSLVLTENIVERRVASRRVIESCTDSRPSVWAEADQSCAIGRGAPRSHLDYKRSSDGRQGTPCVQKTH
jgi:hypothetical protein